MSSVNLTRLCVHCQQAFAPRKPRQRYCSHRCFLDWQTAYHQTNRFRTECKQCGKPIEASPVHRDRKRFCSMSCAAQWRSQNTDISRIGWEASLAERACIHCKQVYKPTSARQKWCSVCAPSKGARSRIRRYGLSQSQIDAMYFQQGGGCLLCGAPEPECIDHDHNTGKVRGLLCRTCNMALAYIENKDWMRKARKYLRQ